METLTSKRTKRAVFPRKRKSAGRDIFFPTYKLHGCCPAHPDDLTCHNVQGEFLDACLIEHMVPRVQHPARSRTCLTFSFQILVKCLRWKHNLPAPTQSGRRGEDQRHAPASGSSRSHQIRRSELLLPPPLPFSRALCTRCVRARYLLRLGSLVAIIYARQRMDLLSVRLLKTFLHAAIGEKNSRGEAFRRVSRANLRDRFASIRRLV